MSVAQAAVTGRLHASVIFARSMQPQLERLLGQVASLSMTLADAASTMDPQQVGHGVMHVKIHKRVQSNACLLEG